MRIPLLAVGIVLLISMCVFFHWPGGVQPGGVVLCIILFNTPAHHIDYAVSRMIDTGVGVVIALLVNYFLPRQRVERWFHLSPGRNGTGNGTTAEMTEKKSAEEKEPATAEEKESVNR